MRNSKISLVNSRIDIRDEKEFKLWIKFIASVYKCGGDIKKPSDILWRSVYEEIISLDSRDKIKTKSFSN